MSPLDRLVGHLEVQVISYVWVRSRDFLIQLRTESRLRGWKNIALFPAHGRLQNLGMEPVPNADTFLDQKVGNTRAQLHVGRAFDWPAIEMGRHLYIVALGHPRDLLGLQNAADTPQRRLQDGGSLVA